MPGGLGVGFVEPPGQAKGCRALVGAVWVGAGLSCLCLPQPWCHRPHLQAKSQFKRRSTANNVEIHIPVPNDADSPKFKTTVGSVKWVPENSEIVWSIKSFPGGKEYLMRAHFGLPSVEAEDKEGKPPISVKFEIPYFTTSGIQVRYLKIIEKSGYQALPWVRYITQNGDYQLRTQ